MDFASEYVQQKEFDRIIAADSGLVFCHKLHLVPTDILGDFDSLQDTDLLDYYVAAGIPIKTFPVRKDYTDTHLAVEYAMDLAPGEVILLGATGSRYDHTLANIGMLEKFARAHISGKIIDEHNEIEMLCGQKEKIYQKDSKRKFFSLLAWGGEVSGIDLIGFSYPLTNASLIPAVSLGISNELMEEHGTLRVRKGNLLVIRSSD